MKPRPASARTAYPVTIARRLAVILALPLAGCLPAEVHAVLAAHGQVVDQPTAVRIARDVTAARTRPAAPLSCREAIMRLWPSGSRSWALTVARRESGGNPRAQNRSSSAAGCFQMLQIHRTRFAKVGCSWARRYEAPCNVLAALDLYREQGARPWRPTSP